MTLSQKHRSAIFEGLRPVIGEEEAEALLSQFPSSRADEPLRREHLDLGLAELRTEIADLRTELHTEIAGVRTEIADLRVEMADRFRAQTTWMVTLNVFTVTFLGTLMAVLR